MSERRKWRAIQAFTHEFVEHVGEEKLGEFVCTPDGTRPSEITIQRRLTDYEVLQLHAFQADAVPENAQLWIFEGFE